MRRLCTLPLAAALLGAAGAFAAALAAGAVEGAVEKQGLNIAAIVMFFIFVLRNAVHHLMGGRTTRSAADFYAAGGGITGFQNGLAIAGDYMSAASFLGISGLVFTSGYDGLIYSVGFLVGWPIVTVPDRRAAAQSRQVHLRRRRRVPARADPDPHPRGVRHAGGGGLLPDRADGRRRQADPAAVRARLLYAVVIVGVLMIVYVTFGGMMATTWVQIIKACLLLAGATFMALVVLWRYGFSPEALFAEAVEVHPKDDRHHGAGRRWSADPISAISLGLALMFGTAGLPHILMRFFTVPDAKAARKSVFYATGFIGYFYILTFIIGFGAIAFVLTDPAFFEPAPTARQPDHRPAGRHQHGGDPSGQRGGRQLFLGFISAVAFATILAVVAGLTLSGASAVSHDLYATVIEHGSANEQKEMRLEDRGGRASASSRSCWAIVFENQNVAFMVGPRLRGRGVSCNFPVLLMSMFWKGCTTRGAMIGGFLGLISRGRAWSSCRRRCG